MPDSLFKGALGKEHASVVLDSIGCAVLTVNMDFRVTYFNREAERVTGVSREEAVGKRCCDVLRANHCEADCLLRQTFHDNSPVVNRSLYIIRPDGKRVPIIMSTALLRGNDGSIIGGVETFRDLTLVEALRKEVTKRHTVHDIVAQSECMKDLLAILPQVAESDSTVLIQGESGTGKELLAHAIHRLSNRKRKKLVTVNSAALPDTLLEAELFGYMKGAFTDAKKDKPGRFARAEGGSLFLDEVADMSPALQVKLLRVLQEGIYEPLGSTEPIRADVRIVTATNKDLEKEVKERRFREDLFYRVNVVTLTLPPLRDRKEDIPLLAHHFIERINGLKGRNVTGLSPAVLEHFVEYDWPGNIRQLRNAIEYAFILCRNGQIEMRHLPERMRPSKEQLEQVPTGLTLEEIEARAIYHALSRNDWKKMATARELGINKTTLWRKVKKLGIKIPETKD
mgnify:FL=1